MVYKCQECGRKLNRPVDECPKCGGSDIDVEVDAASHRRHHHREG
jgi:rRNA maturation endonuclease Nob1